MADIRTIVPLMHADMFRDAFYQGNIWTGLVMDVSGQFTRAGRQYQIPIDVTRYDAEDPPAQAGDKAGADIGGPAQQDNSADYDEDPSLANTLWQNPTIQKVDHVTLTLDQERDSSVLIPYLAEERTLPSLVGSASFNQARVIVEAINKEIRDVFNTQTGDYQMAGPTIANAGAWGQAAHLTALYKMFRDASIKATGWHWPMPGRVCVVGADVYDLVVEVLVDKNIYMPDRDANGNAFLSGMAPMLRGWNVYMDDSIPTGATKANEDARNLDAYFMSARQGVGHAREFTMSSLQESEVRKGWLSKMLVTWGTDILNPRYQFRAATTITA